MKKKLLCIALAFVFTVGLGLTAQAEDLALPAPSCILMEKDTGQILYEENAHEKLRPASVTKIMTLLLIMEQLNRILRRQLCHLLQKHRRSRKQPVCCQRVSVLLQPDDRAADLSGR